MKMTLRACRANKHLNQKEASKMLKINAKTLSFWETGKTFPTTKHIKDIESVYGVNYNDIIFLQN
jgi:transcriptional regulator with XRE-family HTH domain